MKTNGISFSATMRFVYAHHPDLLLFFLSNYKLSFDEALEKKLPHPELLALLQTCQEFHLSPQG